MAHTLTPEQRLASSANTLARRIARHADTHTHGRTRRAGDLGCSLTCVNDSLSANQSADGGRDAAVNEAIRLGLIVLTDQGFRPGRTQPAGPWSQLSDHIKFADAQAAADAS